MLSSYLGFCDSINLMIKLLKEKTFFSIGLLPPVILTIILLLMLVSSGQTATLSQPASEIGWNTQTVNVFHFARNLLFIVYIAYFLLQVFRNKGKGLKSLILITGTGLFLTLFSYLIAGVLYDLISVVITVRTNPDTIPGLKK